MHTGKQKGWKPIRRPPLTHPMNPWFIPSLLKLFRVSGDSMSPAFKSQDYILILTRLFRLKINDNVVVHHPELGIIVKKVINICEQGIRLQGNNPQSTSSQQMGWLKREHIIGKVVMRIPKSASSSSKA